MKKIYLLIFAVLASIGSIRAEEPSVITVAQALTIGEALDLSQTTSNEFFIEGYIVGTEDYNTQYKNQNFWVVDNIGGEGLPLYVYRGKSDVEMKSGYKVSLRTKIQKYGNDNYAVIEGVNSTVTILEDTESSTEHLFHGECGEDGSELTWLFNLHSGRLEIEGNGDMIDSLQYHPWLLQNMKYQVRKVSLPQGLTKIGQSAFDGCTKLDSVVIPENVSVIGKWAFYNCKNLTSLNMPESVQLIGVAAFQGCSLTEPLYNSHMFCFLPTDFTGSYTVPEGIVSVISYSFDQRKGVTEVVLPASVLRIGYRTFRGCTGLQSITCAAVTPPTVQGENFIDVDKTIPLYVPEQSIELYAAADEWKEFTNILPLRSEDVDLVHEVSNTAYKLLHNGHFLILRGDNTYTLTGQEVK